MNTAMVDICLNRQVTHTQFSCVHPCKNNEQSLISSVKSIIGLNVSVISYKVRQLAIFSVSQEIALSGSDF